MREKESCKKIHQTFARRHFHLIVSGKPLAQQGFHGIIPMFLGRLGDAVFDGRIRFTIR